MTISAFLLCVRAKLFCVVSLQNERVSTLGESEIVLHRWLIDRVTFIITISAFLLGVKANLFCIDGLQNEEYTWHVLYFDLALFTNRTIAMTSFSIGTNRTIGTNGPLELPCTQPGHMGK